MLLVAFMSFTTHTEANLWDSVSSFFKKPNPPSPPLIRVLIVHDKAGATLEVSGKYKIIDPHLNEHVSTRFVGKRKFIQAINDGLKWGEEFPGIYQIKIVPDHPRTTTLVDGVEYRGALYIYNIGNSISIVNELYVEDYLNSVLTHQYQEPLPKEAQAAISIVERTNAYYSVFHPKNKFWDVDASVVGYQGYVLNQNPYSIRNAVKTTRYMILSKKAKEGGSFTPFQGQWESHPGEGRSSVISDVSLHQVVEMAKQGENAGQILAKAFPGTTIQWIQYPAETREIADNQN